MSPNSQHFAIPPSGVLAITNNYITQAILEKIITDIFIDASTAPAEIKLKNFEGAFSGLPEV